MTLDSVSLADLVASDERHLIHPLHLPQAHHAQGPIVMDRGLGVRMWDVSGREYIDGLAGLWNVVVGHGRVELAEAAAQQMTRLAYCSSYAGQSNVPAIQLAAKLAEISYPSLNT